MSGSKRGDNEQNNEPGLPRWVGPFSALNSSSNQVHLNARFRPEAVGGPDAIKLVALSGTAVIHCFGFPGKSTDIAAGNAIDVSRFDDAASDQITDNSLGTN